MSIDEDIGGLKADMRTVREETSRISSKIDRMNTSITAHNATERARLASLEERCLSLTAHIEKNINPELKSLMQSRSSMRGWIAGVGAASGLVAATIMEMARSIFRSV